MIRWFRWLFSEERRWLKRAQKQVPELNRAELEFFSNLQELRKKGSY